MLKKVLSRTGVGNKSRNFSLILIHFLKWGKNPIFHGIFAFHQKLN